MLFTNLGRPLSRDYLMETIWGTNRDVMTRTVETHVAKLRAKLGLRPENGFVLITIYGFGYRLEKVDEVER